MKIFLYFDYIFIICIIKINLSLQSCFEYSCEECSSPDYGNCTKCRDTFTLIDGTCPCSFSECALCTTGLAGLHICEQCKNGYYSYQNDCYCQVNNCEQCDEDGCKKCISGYFYNETSKECIKQSDEEKIQCYDPYCEGCFSEEKGACEYCKEGLYLKKGECLNLTIPENGNCPPNYYLNGNYCYEKCSGVNCNRWIMMTPYYLCPDNECLVCVSNELFIISECNNVKECSSIQGCLNCITSDECLVCQQGYYLLGGICKKCGEGCSKCSSINNCFVCLSGYELTENKTCNLTYNFDYNTTVYEAKKINLISIYHPQEIIKTDITDNLEKTEFIEKATYIESSEQIKNTEYIEKTQHIDNTEYIEIIEHTQHIQQPEKTIIPIISTDIIKINNTENRKNNSTNSTDNKINNLINNVPNIITCDKNCIKCFDNTGKCFECDKYYAYIENICTFQCQDENCLSCELKDGKQICKKCIEGYEVNNEKCELICSIDNCLECSLNETELTCSKCAKGYYLENNICKIKCKDDNCNICLKESSICSECKDGFYLDDNICKMKCEDINCLICSEFGLYCTECINGYYLEENICKIKCQDNNCNSCSKDGSMCTECKSDTKLYNGKCALSKGDCHNQFKNCKYCLINDGCIECNEGYELNSRFCIKKEKNYALYLFIALGIILLIISIVVFFIYCKKKPGFVPPDPNIDYDQQSDFQSNNPQIVYNIRGGLDLSGSFRSVLSKEEAAEEFETQRIKSDKGKMTCMYCLKKPGIYRCDCGCVVCKEHSMLKDIEKNGIKYKGCFRCEKIVKKVTLIKKECNICFQRKNVLVHFKCGCAFEVCKNCYIKIKMTGNKCPQCRGLI